MIQGVEIKKLEKFNDDRGWLLEAFRKDDSSYKPAMVYISETKPGVVRGPHEHKKQSDQFIFLAGEFTLYLWENRPGEAQYRQLEKIEVGGSHSCSVLIPPGVVHAYKCTSSIPGLIINLPNKLYKGKGKTKKVDEIRWELISDSPFVVG